MYSYNERMEGGTFSNKVLHLTKHYKSLGTVFPPNCVRAEMFECPQKALMLESQKIR